jgi:signal transduction histidine kinase
VSLPRVRLRTILLLINLVILLLPLGGITWLRLYESALIRQTESELIAQTAFIEATYLSAFDRLSAERRGTRAAIDRTHYGVAVTAPPPPRDPEGRWRPRWAELDLAGDPVWPRPPDPTDTPQHADPLAAQIGRELTPMLREAQRITLAGMRVVDYHGVIVASTGDGARDDTGQSLAALDEVREALTGASVSRMRWRNSESPPPPLESISRGTRIRVYVAEPIERDGRVLGAILLIRTPANIKQAVYGKRVPLMRAGIGLLVLVVLLTLLSSLTISRPVRLLIAQTRRAARGERGAITPLKHPGTREIAELSENVAAMAQTLEDRSAYIRDFAAHVSHEFKTPLTAIQGAVELLRDHGDSMSAEERSRFLDILSADTARLERLVRRLLELARADMMQAGAEHADLGTVTAAVAQRFLDSGLAVQAAGDPGITVEIAGDVLDSMLSSLLDNVRQHGGDGVHVQLWWRLSTERPGHAELHVHDDGRGISAANREKVFEPFFTTARSRGSTGMGLAIIRTLLHAHHGEIELLESPSGTHFCIRLPLAKDPHS